MSYSETEAGEKWCPHAIASHTNPRGGFEPREIWGETAPLKVFPCIGSNCMSWRWSRAKETKAYLDAIQAHMKETGDNFNIATNKVLALVGSTFEHTEGYCGLAGRPE